MQTIRLRVNDKIYQHLMWFLKKISKDELQIIEEDKEFLAAQQEVRTELEQLERGNSEFIDLDQLDTSLEATIRKHLA
jgi:hypothetical protein